MFLARRKGTSQCFHLFTRVLLQGGKQGRHLNSTYGDKDEFQMSAANLREVLQRSARNGNAPNMEYRLGLNNLASRKSSLPLQILGSRRNTFKDVCTELQEKIFSLWIVRTSPKLLFGGKLCGFLFLEIVLVTTFATSIRNSRITWISGDFVDRTRSRLYYSLFRAGFAVFSLMTKQCKLFLK